MTGNPDIYNGLIFGVGPGTVAVIVAALFSVLLCLFKDVLETPNVCVCIAILIPLIVLGIVRALPVQPLVSSTS